MAALNQDETKAIDNAMQLLDYIKRNGFDPKGASTHPIGKIPDSHDLYVSNEINKVRKALHDVRQKKGYYPK